MVTAAARDFLISVTWEQKIMPGSARLSQIEHCGFESRVVVFGKTPDQETAFLG
jgi:hypothetical protein